MYDISVITGENIIQVKNLYMSHTRLQRGKIIKQNSDVDIWVSQGIVIVGSFLSGELVAFMTYKLLTQLPIARIGNIYIKPGFKKTYHFNDDDHPIPKILDFILEIAEKEGYYTWLYSRANLDIYKKLEEKKQDLLYCSKYGYDNERKQYRYDKYIEEIIQPYGKSKFDAYNKMFDPGQYEKEIIIFSCCLKPEYRKWKK